MFLSFLCCVCSGIMLAVAIHGAVIWFALNENWADG